MSSYCVKALVGTFSVIVKSWRTFVASSITHSSRAAAGFLFRDLLKAPPAAAKCSAAMCVTSRSSIISLNRR